MPHFHATAIRLVLFDYGGVIADEGFTAGLRAIAATLGLPPDQFFADAAELVYSCGYVTGRAQEDDFWQAVREKWPISASNQWLTDMILQRFTPRTVMLDLVAGLRRKKIRTAILSDQSDWLDRLEARHHFGALFEVIFNSYHLGQSKREATLFPTIASKLGLLAQEILFVDDNPGHIRRARGCGMNCWHFSKPEPFADFLAQHHLL